MSKASKARKIKAKVQRKAAIREARRRQYKRQRAQRDANPYNPSPSYPTRPSDQPSAATRRPHTRRQLADDEQYREDYRQWAEQRIRNARRRY